MDKKNDCQKVSVVIPCFNEAPTIAALVMNISFSPLVGEIIVVDDASTDETSLQARTAGAEVLTLEGNCGKGAAMKHGVNRARYSTVLFVDGDMDGLCPTVIRNLVTPVVTGSYDMFIGIRRRNSLLLNTLIRFLPLLSGLRAVNKQFWMKIPDAFLTGFGIETVLNYYARRQQCKVGYVIVPGICHKIKEDKYGLFLGMRRRLIMVTQICETWWRLFFLRQLDPAVRELVTDTNEAGRNMNKPRASSRHSTFQSTQP